MNDFSSVTGYLIICIRSSFSHIALCSHRLLFLACLLFHARTCTTHAADTNIVWKWFTKLLGIRLEILYVNSLHISRLGNLGVTIDSSDWIFCKVKAIWTVKPTLWCSYSRLVDEHRFKIIFLSLSLRRWFRSYSSVARFPLAPGFYRANCRILYLITSIFLIATWYKLLGRFANYDVLLGCITRDSFLHFDVVQLLFFYLCSVNRIHWYIDSARQLWNAGECYAT